MGFTYNSSGLNAGKGDGNAMSEWRRHQQHNEDMRRHAIALRLSPLNEAVRVRGQWLPVEGGISQIPGIKRHAT